MAPSTDKGGSTGGSYDNTERHAAGEIVRQTSLRIVDLFDGVLPYHIEMSSGERKYGSKVYGYTLYHEIGDAPMHGFKVTAGKDTQRYIAVGPRLLGMGINGLLHFAAPSKVYGFDTRDILMDWEDLYSDPANKNRLKNHKKIPGWNKFEEHRELILDMISRDYNALSTTQKQQEETDIIVPIVALRKDEEGKLSWDYHIPKELKEKLREQSFPGKNIDDEQLVPVLGPTLVASYSPHITDSWPKELGYTPKGKKTNDMGATQSLPLTLYKAEDLLESPFIQRLVADLDKENSVEPAQEELVEGPFYDALRKLQNHRNFSGSKQAKTFFEKILKDHKKKLG